MFTLNETPLLDKLVDTSEMKLLDKAIKVPTDEWGNPILENENDNA